MDSKGIKFIKTFLLIFVVTIVFLASYKWSEYKLVYAAYIEDRCVAYSESKNKVIDVYNKVIEENKNIEIEGNIKFKRALAKKSSLNNYDSIIDNIKASLDKEIDCILLKIDGKSIGILRDKDEVDNFFTLIKEYYISINNIKTEDLISTSIINDIAYVPYKAYKSEIKDPEALYKIIREIDSNREKPIISVDIIYGIKEIENIPAPTTIITSEDYYMGEVKVEDSGEEGQKAIEKQVRITNSKVMSESKIKEQVIKAPKNKIIVKGSKNPLGTNMAFLQKPSRGSVTSNFGSRWKNESHHGIDIAGNIGEPINAALDGKVNKVGYDNIYGKYIKLDHGKGIETLYGHCSSITRKEGDTVKKGDVIAKIGNTGRSTGPHVHFELRLNGKAENPINYIK
ncbi:peptidoglycan DD-metalloendopeptidase family protein [Clostridium amazonitimonense]|uniref:peptidoglycan DD-metalloendopeptidase family protein n=1 Tax=Clostridium amazonitimonense TaxID=1499689 RepID=UPI0006919361|nr:peptidoglycan DD-metalloendopeptidase family protein [Clostridium amazonitimonense]